MRGTRAWLAVALWGCGGARSALHDAGPVVLTTPAPSIDAAPPPVDAGPPAPPSPACVAARDALLGPAAECVEELVAETPSGRMVRVRDRGDAFAHAILIVIVGDGTILTDWRITEVETQAARLFPAPPEAHARICAALEGHVVRCVADDPHPLPAGAVCPAPRALPGGGVEAIVESSHLIDDDHHTQPYQPTIWRRQWKRACAAGDGVGISTDPHGPLPRTAWLAPPPRGPRSERAPQLDAEVCAAARVHLGPEIRCEAWRFPDLETAAGTIYFASTDSGRRDVLVRRHADGRVEAGASSPINEDLWPQLITEVRAGRVAPETLAALRLLAAGLQWTISGPYVVRDEEELAIELRIDGDARPHGGLPAGVAYHDRYTITFEASGGVAITR